MIRLQPSVTRPDSLFPYTPLFRSYVGDAAGLTRLGLSASSIRDDVERGWLERVGSRLYRRPEPGDGGPVRWEIATLSLQTLLEVPVHVGGMTALELAGY